ncbi:unnamed protein product [Effrenium voratum]|nr:unnamed protein product [Effrenium voratum]
MKAFLAALALASGAKLRTTSQQEATFIEQKSARSLVANCPDNQFPHVNLTIEGVGAHADVLPPERLQELQTNLAGHPDWAIGKPWVLSLEADSLEPAEDREFGFAGGEGFLVFKVPRGSVGKKIAVTSTVETLPDHSRLEYRGAKPITIDNAIKMTNICLRPMTCDIFFSKNPTMCKNDDLWVRRSHPENVAGHTRRACCEEIRCADAAPCVPESKYEKRPDYGKAFGSQPDHCCVPKLCASSICNSSQWEAKPGNVLGSTKEECCTPRDCDDYTCASKFVKKAKRHDAEGHPVLQQGGTDEECCEHVSCDHVKCDATDEWTKNMTAKSGSTLEECCIPLYCAKHSCDPATEWEKDPGAVLGSSNPSCCKPKLCKDFSCNAGFALRAGATMGKKLLRGSTSDECCEKKLCRNWKCSDPTKWVAKADETNNALERQGWSDEECCTPITCSSVDCVPESLWTPKSADELEGLQGSKSEQCCNPRWCAVYTCTGDIPDMNVSSTKWFKKMDTNHFKFRGSTDEECCHPKYCSEFFTAFPTKYERKPEDHVKPRQGSTEAECYNELKCSDYCCVNPDLSLKEDAAQILGSTDAECCEQPK